MTSNPGSPAYGKAPSKVNLTPEEEFVYKQLFAAADSETLGVVTGQQAVPFFANAKLPSSKLGEVWQLADEDDQGFLLPHQFDVALKLIALAQSGLAPTLANLHRMAVAFKDYTGQSGRVFGMKFRIRRVQPEQAYASV
ncbi:hypothetical protein BJ684DRAFT_21834 [Piptocephalis cylindrospora]|uniref:EH domain-containing protein n=1 Tax=Piptocephalis cylindrospora TaxID=1907219 RepID=A0A4P9Y0N3_9FUNG|nr:hypothetical protein BJ684DRAFT_21834 [Piptocephalis cylindrospora]|eukprot:RKP11591.1 hypothetical protein BJ684DRAFT_21834 [Piptocephalis cylindrospora]